MFVVATVLLVLVALLPIKIAASLVGARNTGFGACLVAVIVAVLIHIVLGRLIHYGQFVGVLITGAVYMGLLETSYLKGVLIAMLQVLLSWVLKIVLIALGFVTLVHLVGPTLGPTAGGTWI